MSLGFAKNQGETKQQKRERSFQLPFALLLSGPSLTPHPDPPTRLHCFLFIR